jgi:hypothetical protein
MRRYSLALLLLTCSSPAAAQPDPPDHVPRIDVAIGASVAHGGGGAVAAVGGNLTNTIAITSEVATSADRTTLLAGARVGTGFRYDGKPPMPGRFFAQIMAGRSIVQPGVGADVIVLPHSAVSVHWSLDYRWVHEPCRRDSAWSAHVIRSLIHGPRSLWRSSE